MESLKRIDDWIKQNAPMLSHVYENKWVGMLYDRFGSLPPKQQRHVVIASFGGVGLIMLSVLLSGYFSYWSQASSAYKARQMVTMLQQYQQNQRNRDQQVQILEQNNRLAEQDALKRHIIDQGKAANISPRMIKAEERSGGPAPDESSKGNTEVKVKQASVKLERVNLSQLRSFLHSIEYGPYNLSVSSLVISNDDKLRGYMNVELGVVAYLFRSEGESL